MNAADRATLARVEERLATMDRRASAHTEILRALLDLFEDLTRDRESDEKDAQIVSTPGAGRAPAHLRVVE